MVAENDIDKLVAHFSTLKGWPNELVVPDGYPDSLALCIIDAIWSIGVRYRGVENVLDKYRQWLGRSNRGGTAGRTSNDLVEDIAAAGGPAKFADEMDNHQRTSPRNGILKAQAVSDAAAALRDEGVLTVENFQTKYRDAHVKKAWTSVHGQRSGISWHYLVILAGMDDLKADRMVTAFVNAGLRTEAGRRMTSDDAYALVVAAYDTLDPSLRPDLRALDHAIWRSQRQR